MAAQEALVVVPAAQEVGVADVEAPAVVLQGEVFRVVALQAEEAASQAVAQPVVVAEEEADEDILLYPFPCSMLRF